MLVAAPSASNPASNKSTIVLFVAVFACTVLFLFALQPMAPASTSTSTAATSTAASSSSYPFHPNNGHHANTANTANTATTANAANAANANNHHTSISTPSSTTTSAPSASSAPSTHAHSSNTHSSASISHAASLYEPAVQLEEFIPNQPNPGTACPDPLPALTTSQWRGSSIFPRSSFFSVLDICTAEQQYSLPCLQHPHYSLYQRYLAPLRFHTNKLRILQIGLTGCHSATHTHTPGQAILSWLHFFGAHIAALDLHIIESDQNCVDAFLNANPSLHVIHAADAMEMDKEAARSSSSSSSNSNFLFLHQKQDPDFQEFHALDGLRIVLHAANPNSAHEIEQLHIEQHFTFHVIVDAGMEAYPMNNNQVQKHALTAFFPKALKPGGIHVVAAMYLNFEAQMASSTDQAAIDASTYGVLKSVVDYMNGDPRPSVTGNNLVKQIAPELEHMDCYYEICILQKHSRYALQFSYQEGGSSCCQIGQLPQCHPAKGLEIGEYKDRTRPQMPNKDLKYGERPFLAACHRSETDKCLGHAYQYAYERYLTPIRHALLASHASNGVNSRGRLRLFEIGLGCQQTNLGASFRLWTDYFAGIDLELHIMEYDKPCAQDWYSKLSTDDKARVYLHFGDQSKRDELLAAIREAGGFEEPFDIITDDGGHGMTMQQVTIATLMEFVKPGGLFFMEDLLTSYYSKFFNPPDFPTTTEALAQMNSWLQGDGRIGPLAKANRHGVMRVVPLVSHMDFFPQLTVMQRRHESHL